MQIGEVAKRIILDWVIARHSHILEWTGRAFDIEVGSTWELDDVTKKCSSKIIMLVWFSIMVLNFDKEKKELYKV